MNVNIESFQKPNHLNEKFVIKWSNTYKRLEILEKSGIKTYSIRQKAIQFLKNKCIEYSKEKKCYICKPIKGYNKTYYEMRPKIIHYNGEKIKTFDCTCQFYNKVVKNSHPYLVCSHVLALKLQLKIWNWENVRNRET